MQQRLQEKETLAYVFNMNNQNIYYSFWFHREKKFCLGFVQYTQLVSEGKNPKVLMLLSFPLSYIIRTSLLKCFQQPLHKAKNLPLFPVQLNESPNAPSDVTKN